MGKKFGCNSRTKTWTGQRTNGGSGAPSLGRWLFSQKRKKQFTLDGACLLWSHRDHKKNNKLVRLRLETTLYRFSTRPKTFWVLMVKRKAAGKCFGCFVTTMRPQKARVLEFRAAQAFSGSLTAFSASQYFHRLQAMGSDGPPGLESCKTPGTHRTLYTPVWSVALGLRVWIFF